MHMDAITINRIERRKKKFYKDLNRFWSHVERDFDDYTKCWHWKGATQNERGYGSFYLYGRGMGAHRAAFLLTRGVIPKGMYILHACDNPSCVNPVHLYPGTQSQNMREHNDKRKEIAKLSTAEIDYIKEKHFLKWKITSIAESLNIHRNTVYNIINH